MIKAKKIDPQPKIAKELDLYIEKTHGSEDFSAHATAEGFFQHYFQTDLKLNDFKNISGYLKRHEDKYDFRGVEKGRKYYRRVLDE